MRVECIRAGLVVAVTAITSCGSGGPKSDGQSGSDDTADNEVGTGENLALDDEGSLDVSGNGIEPVAPGTDFDACTGVAEESENTFAPADIVFLVDNSPSMRDEIRWTRENMNEFSRTIADRGIDPRIVMISCLLDGCDGHRNTLGICIEPPIGSGDCTTSDSNAPGYLHIDQRMPSQKLLERAVDTYDSWKSELRSFAQTHFVAISDDGDLTTAADFEAQLAALDPPIDGYVFHGIFSSMSKEAACGLSADDPCCRFAAPGGEGVSYRDLSLATGGVAADLCAQDFAPVFAQFAQSVIDHSELNCEWVIPPPPPGDVLDPSVVNVLFTSGGESTYFRYASTSERCGTLDDAWYYDDPSSPTRVIACPATCERIREAPGPSIEVSFGCQTIEASPIY